MRQYEPIWHRIKTRNSASISTHPDNAARVIKAVIKEKHRDTGYKLLLSEKALKSKLNITKEVNGKSSEIIIHFSLETSIQESYIGVSNL